MNITRPNNSQKIGSLKAVTYLSLFGLAITVPLLLLFGVLLLESASVQRTQLEARVLQVLDALVNDIDRDLDRDITILHTLATSQALASADWRTFYDQATAALQGRAYLVLVDSSGRQLVNTYVHYGEQPAMTGDPETVRRILESKAPVVSNLFVSLVVKKPVFNVSIPIVQDGRVRYVMSLGLLTDDLVPLLKSQKLGADWVSLIWDANGVILARSRDNPGYVGTRLPQNMREHDQRAVVRTTNLDGVDVLHATVHSQLYGWGVGVNFPYTLVAEQLRNSLLLWGAAGLLAITIALVSGVFFARQITSPLSVAANAAAAFGRGESFPLGGSRLKEADSFIVALKNAQRAREKLNEKITQSRDWLQTILASIGDAVMATDANGRIAFLNPIAEQLTGWPAPEAEERALQEVFRIIDEQSRQTVENPVARVLREGKIVGLPNHTLLISRDGKETAIDDNAAPIRNAQGQLLGVVLVFRDIAEKRAAERALSESEDLYRTTFAHAVVGIAHLGLDGRWLRINDAVCAITGYSREELANKTFADITHPDDIEADWVLARRVAAGEIPSYSMEKRYIRKDGSTVWVILGVALLSDRDGSPKHFVSIIQDVTARRQAEEKFHFAVEAAPNGIVITNACGEIVLVNASVEKLFGYSREQLIGKPVELLVPDQFRQSHQSNREGFLVEPQKRSMGAGRDLYGRRNDGSEFPIEIGLNPIQTDREMLVLGSIVDITQRREVEAAQRLLALVVESSVDGIISKDLNGLVTSWNRGAERMFGYSEQEMIGRPISVIVAPDLVNEIPAALERIKNGEPTEQYEIVRRAKNGSLITVSTTWSPIHDSSGRVVGASKVVRDVTERKRLEEQRLELLAKDRALVAETTLRETEAELARVVRALSVGELATSIAHEINQPLAGVVTNAEAAVRWLSGETPNIQEAMESLALIARDGNRASAVIRRIREFLRKGPAETVVIDINVIVKEAAALARPELLKRTITLCLELSSEPVTVRGDRIQLQQVVLNLMMNGAEAMNSAEGQKDLHVTSRTSPDGGALVAVRDSGVGINPEHMARMFDPFFTTKPTGMGMGLSISRTIIEAHGGRIWAEINDDRGLTVQFGLPPERSTLD